MAEKPKICICTSLSKQNIMRNNQNTPLIREKCNERLVFWGICQDTGGGVASGSHGCAECQSGCEQTGNHDADPVRPDGVGVDRSGNIAASKKPEIDTVGGKAGETDAMNRYVNVFRSFITPEDSSTLDTDLRVEIRFPGLMQSAKTLFWLFLSIALPVGIARIL
jgi:hypothetical protein